MYSFNYQKPATLDAARQAIVMAADGKFLAGGMTLLPTLKLRLAQPSDLIDLAALEQLKGIQQNGDNIVIGALATHYEVANSELVKTAIPALAELASHIGDPQVRNRGTIGGSVANNDPSADYPAALLGLNATVISDQREVSADDFFVGMFETALADAEIITAVRFPVPDRAAYRKFPNPASRYAIAGVMVAQTGGETRVAVTGAGNCVFRVAEMEQALAADFTPESVADILIPDAELNADIHAGAEYRAHLVTVMAKRAVAAAQ